MTLKEASVVKLLMVKIANGPLAETLFFIQHIKGSFLWL